MFTKEDFDNIVTNYATEDPEYVKSGLEGKYGADKAGRIIQSIKSKDYDLFNSIVNVEDSLFEENEPVEVEDIKVQEGDIYEPLEDACNKVIQDIQTLPPEVAQNMVAEVKEKVSKEFSEGIDIIYRARNNRDFSENLKTVVVDAYKKLLTVPSGNFSESEKSEMFDFISNGRPSDFSILETCALTVSALGQFSADDNVVTNFVSSLSDKDEPEMASQVDPESMGEAPTVFTPDQIVEMYASLRSDDEKQRFLKYLESAAYGGQLGECPECECQGKEGELNCAEGEAEPELAPEVIESQLSDNDSVKALVEKYKSLTSSIAKEQMQQMLVSKFGEQIANYIVSKAEGQSFSEEKAEGEEAQEANVAPEKLESLSDIEAMSDSPAEYDLGDGSAMPVAEEPKIEEAKATPVVTLEEGSLEDIASGDYGTLFEEITPESEDSSIVGEIQPEVEPKVGDEGEEVYDLSNPESEGEESLDKIAE